MFGFVNGFFRQNSTRSTSRFTVTRMTFFSARQPERLPTLPVNQAVAHPPWHATMAAHLDPMLAEVLQEEEINEVSLSGIDFWVQEAADGPTDVLKAYLASFSDTEPSYSERFEALKLANTSEYDRFCCPISLEIFNRPVLLDGVLFDYDSLLAIPVIQGERHHPINTDNVFYVAQIEPAFECNEAMQAYFKAFEKNEVETGQLAPNHV